jgi:hypothetical protein
VAAKGKPWLAGDLDQVSQLLWVSVSLVAKGHQGVHRLTHASILSHVATWREMEVDCAISYPQQTEKERWVTMATVRSSGACCFLGVCVGAAHTCESVLWCIQCLHSCDALESEQWYLQGVEEVHICRHMHMHTDIHAHTAQSHTQSHTYTCVHRHTGKYKHT